MNVKLLLVIVFLYLGGILGYGQTRTEITAVLNDSTRIFNIQQKIIYKNSSNEVMEDIYLNDWANSYKDKTTPLAKRFAEDYLRRFHFAKEEERGYTKIYSVTDANVRPLTWSRADSIPDVVHVYLGQDLQARRLYRN